MHRSVGVGVVVIVLVVTGCAGAAVATTSSTGFSPTPSTTDAGTTDISAEDPSEPRFGSTLDRVQSPSEFDTTYFEITVHEDGSATWTFRHERRLEDQSDREDFEAFAEEFESEELPLYERFVDQATVLTESGTERTDREMGAESFNRTAGVEQQINAIGVVEMSFTWTNFASVDEETGSVRAGGDVFEGNLYISDSQTLTFEPGENLAFQRTTPDGDYTADSLREATSVEWAGEREFGDGQPIVEFSREDGQSVQQEGGTVLSTPSSPWAVGIAFVVVFALGVIAAAAWYRYRAPTDVPSASGEAEERPTAERDEPGPGDGPIDPMEDESGPIPDEELLTDEDRVVELIRRNGGRMKQVQIVEETGWSKSKVSMLLSDMADDGTVSKLRVGRENIISLEGNEPEATKSPFDET